MKFTALPLAGLMLIEPEPARDERGHFARFYCEQEFGAHGLESRFVQWSVSRNLRRHTLRGMHYAVAPHAEIKLIHVARGAIHDVVVDLRPDSPTFQQWHAVALDALLGQALYVPEGFAHGFQTLVDDTDVVYYISTPYVPEAARAVRWNDPAFGIRWPDHGGGLIISPRDRDCPDFVA